MKKNILRICAFAFACLTFLFLIICLCVHGDAETAMKALSLIFTMGIIACLVLEEVFKRRKEQKSVASIDTPAETPYVPTESAPTAPVQQ